MLYYKKGNLFYKLDPEVKSYTEVFSATDQCRIMYMKDLANYSATETRINQANFDQSDATEFTQVLTVVLTRLGS